LEWNLALSLRNGNESKEEEQMEWKHWLASGLKVPSQWGGCVFGFLVGYGLHGSQWLRPRKQTTQQHTPLYSLYFINLTYCRQLHLHLYLIIQSSSIIIYYSLVD